MREEIAGLIVGLPVHLDGREGVKAVEARAFGAWLGEQTGLPVVFYDERFTTVEADRALKASGKKGKARRRTIDESAAAVLLQAWLESGVRG